MSERTTKRPFSAGESLLLLGACGLGSLLIYSVALARFPLLGTYRTQVFTLDQQVAADPGLAPALAAGASLLCLLYLGGYAALRAALRAAPSRLHVRLFAPVVALIALAAAGLLLLAHPTSSLDLYDYLFRGHVAARYGANNYVQTPEAFRGVDKLYWYTAWRRAVTAYGPLWEGLSIVVARIAGSGLLSLLVSFKLVSAIGWLFCGVAIVAAARPGERLLAGYLWLWNPLALWELVGAAHNDGWMLLFGALALLVWPRRPVVALLLITVGALVKVTLALLWPVLLAAALRRAAGWRARLGLALGVTLASVTLAALAYAPWWAGPAMLEQLWGRASLFTNSPLALARALWMPHGQKEAIEQGLALAGLGMLTLGLATAIVLAWRRPHQTALISAGLLIWLVTVCSPWVQPWYLLWPMALLALRPSLSGGAMWLALPALSGLLIYPAYSGLRPLLGWPIASVAWQGLVLALISGPTLSMLLYGRRFRRTRDRAPTPTLIGYQSETSS